MAYHLEPGYLHSTVVNQLKEKIREGVSIKSIADELSNQGVEYQWLHKMVTGQIRSPDVNKMEVLFVHLTGQDLNAAA